jgi:Fe-S-cluster containining protein
MNGREMNDIHTVSDTISAHAELLIGSYKLKLNLVVPTDEVPPESLMPTLRELCNQVADGVVQIAQDNGNEISCKQGCGACCRQYVPISPAEARLMFALVEELPESRRSIIKNRFEEAVQRFKESEVVESAMDYNRLPEVERMKMVKDYFQFGIACPFLENESCSIYADRPLICREYLVISSPRHCATLDEDQIERLKLPVSVAQTFSNMEGARRKGVNPCLPLIMALEWTSDHPDDCESLPGPKWVQFIFEDLSGAKIPDPDLA